MSASILEQLLRDAGRVGGAEPERLRALGDLAWHAVQGEHAHPVRSWYELAFRCGGDANDPLGVYWHALAVDLELAGAAQDDVDLLLAVVGVVVFWVVLGAGRHVEHLKPERLHAQLRTRSPEGAVEDRLHLVKLLHRVAVHRRPLSVVNAP